LQREEAAAGGMLALPREIGATWSRRYSAADVAATRDSFHSAT
jgi:hypothetical protein